MSETDAVVIRTVPLVGSLAPLAGVMPYHTTTTYAQNFTMFGGDTTKLEVTINTDITGATAIWQLAKSAESAPILGKTIDAGITLSNPTAGILDVLIDAVDTEAIAPGKYYHELEVRDSQGAIATVIAGYVTILPALIDHFGTSMPIPPAIESQETTDRKAADAALQAEIDAETEARIANTYTYLNPPAPPRLPMPLLTFTSPIESSFELSSYPASSPPVPDVDSGWVYLYSGYATGTGNSGDAGVGSGNVEHGTSGYAYLYTGDPDGALGSSGNAVVSTGSGHGAGQKSGDIVLVPGNTNLGATPGDIIFTLAQNIDASATNGNLVVQNYKTADPNVADALWFDHGIAKLSGETTKPTVTGSRGGNAALASLITALASLNLITDATTA